MNIYIYILTQRAHSHAHARAHTHGYTQTHMVQNWVVLFPLAVIWWLVLSVVKIQLYLLLLGIACTKHWRKSKIVQAAADSDLHRRFGPARPQPQTLDPNL